MANYATFPDIEALLIQELAAGGVPAKSALPKNPTYPVVTLQRIGGLPAEKHHIDYANVQVDVWGNDKADASDLAYLARNALHELEGTFVGESEAFITQVDDSLGISWLPDPVTDRARYVFAVGVYLTVPNDN